MSSRAPSQTPPACPLCGGGSRLLSARGDRSLHRCTRCRHLWVPQGVKTSAAGIAIYDDDQSLFFGEGRADYYLDDTAREAAAAKLAWVEAHVPNRGVLLDIGANVGHFAKAAAARFETTAIEPNVHAVRWARERLHAPVAAGSIYDAHPAFAGRFDAVTLFDVIEHLPDAKGALAQCRRWLRPGGRLFVTTPDAGSLAARVMGRHWHYIDLDEHIGLLSRATLGRLLADCGFRAIAWRSVGRRYRFSYVEARLRHLARDTAALRVAHLAAQPLRLWPSGRVWISLGDVMGVVAEPLP